MGLRLWTNGFVGVLSSLCCPLLHSYIPYVPVAAQEQSEWHSLPILAITLMFNFACIETELAGIYQTAHSTIRKYIMKMKQIWKLAHFWTKKKDRKKKMSLLSVNRFLYVPKSCESWSTYLNETIRTHNSERNIHMSPRERLPPIVLTHQIVYCQYYLVFLSELILIFC